MVYCLYLCQILTDFQNYFTGTLTGQFVIKWFVNINLNSVATLSCEIYSVRCCTVLHPSLWISGVLNKVFVSGLPGLLGLSVHSQWHYWCIIYGTEWPILRWCAVKKLLTHSGHLFQYARALICRSCALFPECFFQITVQFKFLTVGSIAPIAPMESAPMCVYSDHSDFWKFVFHRIE